MSVPERAVLRWANHRHQARRGLAWPTGGGAQRGRPVEPDRRRGRRSGSFHTEPRDALQGASGTGRDPCGAPERAYRPRAVLVRRIARESMGPERGAPGPDGSARLGGGLGVGKPGASPRAHLCASELPHSTRTEPLR